MKERFGLEPALQYPREYLSIKTRKGFECLCWVELDLDQTNTEGPRPAQCGVQPFEVVSPVGCCSRSRSHELQVGELRPLARGTGGCGTVDDLVGD